MQGKAQLAKPERRFHAAFGLSSQLLPEPAGLRAMRSKDKRGRETDTAQGCRLRPTPLTRPIALAGVLRRHLASAAQASRPHPPQPPLASASLLITTPPSRRTRTAELARQPQRRAGRRRHRP